MRDPTERRKQRVYTGTAVGHTVDCFHRVALRYRIAEQHTMHGYEKGSILIPDSGEVALKPRELR